MITSAGVVNAALEMIAAQTTIAALNEYVLMIKTLGRAFGRLLPGAAIAALLLVASPPSHAQLILGGGGGTPTYFVGASAGSANAYTLASPTPSSGWALTAGYTVSTTFPAANTGASTEAVAGTPALPIVAAQGNSLFALTGGEIQTGPSYLLTYSTNAATACGGSCYVLSPAGAQLVAFGANTTVTAYQWDAGDVFLATASGLTLTLPQASTVSKNIGIYLATGGNAVTLAPNAADGINGGAVNTSVTAPANAGILITTGGADGTGAIEAPGAGVVAAGTCTSCNLTVDAGGRVTALANGSGGVGSFVFMMGQYSPPLAAATNVYCPLTPVIAYANNGNYCGSTESAAELLVGAARKLGALSGVTASGLYVQVGTAPGTMSPPPAPGLSGSTASSSVAVGDFVCVVNTLTDAAGQTTASPATCLQTTAGDPSVLNAAPTNTGFSSNTQYSVYACAAVTTGCTGYQIQASGQTLGGAGYTISAINSGASPPGTNTASNTFIATLDVNGSAPANGPTCTISGAATSCSDTTHSASVPAGGTVDVYFNFTGSTPATTLKFSIDAQ